MLVLVAMTVLTFKNSNAQQLLHLVINKMEGLEIRTGITLATASGAKDSFVYFKMKIGVTVTMHSHENEQYSFILKCKGRTTIGDTVFIINEGKMIIIPANVPHRFTCLKNKTIVK